MRKALFILVVGIITSTNLLAQHNIRIHVSITGADSNSVGLPDKPFRNIQTAINYAQNGDSIFISSGTYYENLYIRDKKLFVTGTNNQNTLIDGSANGLPVIRLEGTPNQNSNRCTIKNLTLQNGRIITGEYGSILDIKVCNVPTIENCIIKGGREGTASVYIYYCDSAQLRNVEVFNNNTKIRAFSSKVFIDNSKIHHNSDPANISGFQIWRGVATINNSVFFKNQSGIEFLDNRRSCALEASEGAQILVYNSTILNNNGPSNTGRGIHVQTDAKAFVRNSIIWGQDSSSLSLFELKDSIDVDYCIVQNGRNGVKSFGPGTVVWGQNNINANPLIIDTLLFELSNQSAAIGAASLAFNSNKDLYGNNRPNPIGSNPDMGAVENHRAVPVDSSCAYAFVNGPNDQSLERGLSTSFNVSSIGTYNYQWQSNAASLGWINITNNTIYNGSNTSMLNINNTSYSNEAQLFRVIASKTNCADTSKIVKLTISTLAKDSLKLINTSDSLNKLYNLYVNKHDTIYIKTNLSQDTLVIGLRSGIDENTAFYNLIKIYPNPTASEINIKPTKATYILSKLYNNQGQLMLESSSDTIVVSSLAPGIYTLILFDRGGKTISSSKINIIK